MKKTIKIIAILVIMSVILVILTACGENKLIATKTMTEEEDGTKGEVRVEILFEKDIAKSIDMIMELEDEEEANQFYQLYEMAKNRNEQYPEEGMEELDFNVKQEGKKIIISSNNMETLYQEENLKTKEEIKAYFEEQGFTVK